MSGKNDPDNRKRPYEKPVLRSFKLAADEVLAKGCKLSSGGPTYQSFAGLGCALGGCFNVGS